MNKSKAWGLGLLVAVAVVFGGWGLYTKALNTDDLTEAAKVTVKGGDPVLTLCTSYAAKKGIVIAPSEKADAVSTATPNTPVVAPGPTEGSTTTTVTPGPVPLGMPLPDGAGPQPPEPAEPSD